MEEKRCHGCMQIKWQSPICEHCGYDERRQNAPHQLPVGTVLQGKYLIGRVLGQGGFGITYLGQDIKLNIPVAIKEYYPTGMVTRESGVASAVTVVTGGEDTRFAENRDRFLREAQTLARLEDVSEVVQVKNFFEENNTAYIVMGYVKGITLKEHMRRSGGKLSPREVFRLLEPVMEGLGQVHELGLVHRDISPDNIMLQPNRKARLIDFGAAHTATSAGDKSTQAVLKHGFAPPEQYQSKGNLGPWTDVYAVCATVYHCITGLMPPNITDRFMGEADFEWDALSGLTAGQLAALKQGLALQYKDRFQTMEELCAKLFDREEPVPQSAPMPAPVPQPEPKPTPKPQPRQEEPSVSETGTVALIREQIEEVPAVLTAPVVQEFPSANTPAEPQPSYTAPVLREESYTAPVVQEQPAAEPKEEQPTPAEPEKQPEQEPKKKPWIWIAAGILAGLLLLFVSIPPVTPQTTPQATQPPVSQTETLEAIPNGSRVLMNQTAIWGDVPDGEYVFYTYLEEKNYAFGTKALRTEVSRVTFLDTTKDAPANAVDASQNQDGSVLAWVIPNGEMYDLYLAADGKIIAPENCEDMFQCYYNVTEIQFNGIFDTRNATDMNEMFAWCHKLSSLDLSGFDTSNVQNMRFMFYYCDSMEELDVTGFNTENVMDMAGLFGACFRLTALDVSNFDTKNVTDMACMFSCCYGLKKLDLSGFNTGNVTDMVAMFEQCYSLEELDVSNFDTGNVTDMEYMFYGTNKLKNVDGNFDVSNVTDYDEFMDSRDTFNGRPWEELFR